jgi:protein-arginine kinase activator protein McsA
VIRIGQSGRREHHGLIPGGGRIQVDLARREIAEGLKAGEKVVIAGSEDFENAAQVKINE